MKKKNQELIEKFDLTNTKSLEEAIEILPKISTSKFVGGGDLDIVLNLKENQLKESVRGSINLPNKISEDQKIVVLCENKDIELAKKAGAVDAGLDDLMEKIQNNKVQFDIVIATPSVMPKIVKLGKVLGPKGLMPNPKNGTISNDVESAVKSFMAGKTSFKMVQGQGVIRGKVVKLDMKAKEMEENIISYIKGISVEVKKLTSVPFKKIVLKPTMGPSIKLEISDIIARI